MVAVVEEHLVRCQLAVETDLRRGVTRDPQHLRVRLGGLRRAVDAEHAAAAALEGEAGDHAGLRRARDGADDDRVEVDAEIAFLLGQLDRPAREAEAAERMVGGTGRDRVRLAARLLHVAQRLLPRLLEADAEAGLDQPHVGAAEPRHEDVADPVVGHVGPVDPALLYQHALQPEARRHRRHLPRVVGLHAADRDQRVAAGRERVGDQVLELAGLVAAEGDARVAVVALGPQPRRRRDAAVRRSSGWIGEGPNSSGTRANESSDISTSGRIAVASAIVTDGRRAPTRATHRCSSRSRSVR